MKKTNSSIYVDKYISGLPKAEGKVLKNLRHIIKSVAKNAKEDFSYRMPVYKYNGMLVGFSAFQNHCSFFTMSPALMKKMKNELRDYKTSTGTIQFTIDKPLSDSLIKKILKARIKENEERKLNKK